jgi:hypothetical protein
MLRSRYHVPKIAPLFALRRMSDYDLENLSLLAPVIHATTRSTCRKFRMVVVRASIDLGVLPLLLPASTGAPFAWLGLADLRRSAHFFSIRRCMLKGYVGVISVNLTDAFYPNSMIVPANHAARSESPGDGDGRAGQLFRDSKSNR